jgi:hypothetical protein
VASYRQQIERTRRYLIRLEQMYSGAVHNRPNEELLDDVYTCFENCYHVKDWLKNDTTFTKRSPEEIENYVTNTPELAITADICNAQKHFSLNRIPRSGALPIAKPAEIIVELSDSFGAESDVDEPVTISIRVYYEHNGTIYDALDLARAAMKAWDFFTI